MPENEDKLEQFIDEISVVINKYNIEGLIIAVGIRRGEIVDEACTVKGDTDYIARMLAKSMQYDPKLHEVIDNTAIAIAVEDKELKGN